VHGSHRTALGLLLGLGALGLAYRGVLGLELVGWDSYPMIAASRVERAGDLAATLGRELMDGRYPGGRFHRPLTSLSFALDWALWGLRPLGYQLTNLVALGAGALAVHALARRLLGSGAGAWLAPALFALHPLQLEVVPVASRRADLLAALFTSAALAASLGARSRRANALAALCVAAAATSKEIGAVALPLIAAAAFLLPAEATARERLGAALRAAALPAAAFAAVLAARIAALGGLGGHPESSFALAGLRGLAMLPEIARSLLEPQPLGGSPAESALAFLALLGAVAAGLWLVARAEPPRADAPAPRRVLAVLAVWLAALLALTSVSGVRASWYGVPFLPPYALALGLLADGAVAAARARRRRTAVLAGGVCLALVASHLGFSSLVHDYPEWRTVSEQQRAFLARLADALPTAVPGTTLAVEGLPLGEAKPRDEVGIRSALGISDYGAQAWAELRFPSQPVRVVLHLGPPPTPPTPGVVTIDAVPLPSPVLRAGAPP